jgi:hypothetical protein
MLSKEPNGVLEELAAIPYYAKVFNACQMKLFEICGTGYGIVFGYTTAQEGRAMEQHELLAVLQKKVLEIRYCIL